MLGLIVDDEQRARTMLCRMVESLGVETQPSETGLELLQMLEEGTLNADFLILNINMKALDGIEALRAIRLLPQYRKLPVVCVTSNAVPEVIRELIAIGVSEIFLKPIRPEAAIPKLREVIKRAGRWRQQASAGVMSELLLVDSDPNFLAFAEPLLSRFCRVTEVTSAIKATALFQSGDARQGVIVVSDNLKLMGPDRLVEAIHRISGQLKVRAPEIYLLMSAEPADAPPGNLYHGLLKKSFIPDQFISEFRRVVLRSSGPDEKLVLLLEHELRAELLSATQQTVGVLAGQEVVQLPPAGVPGLVLPIRSTLVMGGPECGVFLELSLLSDPTSVVGLATQMLGDDLAVNDAAEILAELANNVAGRLRASLLTRGLDLKMGLPTNVMDEPAKAPSEWPWVAAFRSTTGAQLMLGIRVRKAGAPAG